MCLVRKIYLLPPNLIVRIFKQLNKRYIPEKHTVTDALGYPQIDGVNCLGVDRQADQ